MHPGAAARINDGPVLMEPHHPVVRIASAPGSHGGPPARASGAPPQPVAIVVTSTADAEVLGSCLESLQSCRESGAELYVVWAGAGEELRELIDRFPFATFVVARPGTTRRELRRIGFLQSTRNIVVFVDDRMPERTAWTAMLNRCWPTWIENGGRLPASAGREWPPSERPVLSVVVPVHNGEETLALALDALMASDLPRESWELVVVDDASGDETAVLAAERADRVMRLPGHKHGPGYARNRGFELTLGDCVAFVDADVMVRPDTLRRAATLLLEDSLVDAVFATYDVPPPATGFVSQYRNLLLRYHQPLQVGYSSTFKSACGVIRGEVFETAGGYDEWHFARHQLEDLELGRRLAGLGHRILLDPHMRVTHLKRWTLRRMIVSEIVDHAVPWMRLVNRFLTPMQDAARSFRATKRRNVALTCLAAGLALLDSRGWSIIPLLGSFACLGLVVINNRAQFAFFRQQRGFAFAVATVPMDVLYYLICGLGIGTGWLARQMLGDPRPSPAAEAFTEMAVKRWPPVPVKRAIDGDEPNDVTSIT